MKLRVPWTARPFLIVSLIFLSGCAGIRRFLNPYGPPPPPPKTTKQLLDDGIGTMKKDGVVMLLGFPDKCEPFDSSELCQWSVDKKANSRSAGSASAFSGVGFAAASEQSTFNYTAIVIRFQNAVMKEYSVSKK